MPSRKCFTLVPTRAALVWVHGFNNRRLLEPLGYVPPAKFEAAYDQQSQPMAA